MLILITIQKEELDYLIIKIIINSNKTILKK